MYFMQQPSAPARHKKRFEMSQIGKSSSEKELSHVSKHVLGQRELKEGLLILLGAINSAATTA